MVKAASVVAYDEVRLRQALQLNAEPVSVPSLMKAFGLKEADKPIIETSLRALVTEGFAFSDLKSRYAATKPMSDLVVAQVGKIIPGRPVPVYVQGANEDLPFPVTMSANQVKKLAGRNALKEGDQIAAVLWRCGAGEMKARFVGKFMNGKPPTIVGHFNDRSGKIAFTALDSGISTSFDAVGHIPQLINPKKSYWAAVPAAFDPYKPKLLIGEQKWDPDTGTPIAEIIAKKHGVQIRHARSALLEAKAATMRETPYLGRRDLTHERILVIDPPYAKDHDDGILIQRTRDGFRTLVVIADVPFHVRPGSELDKSARTRGFTHYFPDETYHMLPQRLVKHASLHEGQMKPVIYVEQFWDESGNTVGYPDIGAGVIAAQKHMIYGQFEDKVIARDPDIQSYIELGDIMIERMRFEKGIVFDNSGLDQRAIYSQALVSSMMIEANSAIAEHLLYNNVPFLTRSHSGSDDIFAFHETKTKLEDWGYEVPDDLQDMNAGVLNQIIREAHHRGQQGPVENLIRSKFLHLASYSTIPLSHFGLNRENYTHATSPIRRYADILTLRGVHTSLGNKELGLSDDDTDLMARTATSLNVLQDVNRRVAHDMLKYYATRDLLRLEGHMIRATLHKIEGRNVEVLLPERFGLRKSFDIAALPEGWSARIGRKQLIFKGEQPIPEGSQIRLRITNVRPHEADWDFDTLEPVGGRRKAFTPATPAARIMAGMS